ncbi:MAG: hypothetical protein Q9159_004375 [Coniocarpon cinnabarinum]
MKVYVKAYRRGFEEKMAVTGRRTKGNSCLVTASDGAHWISARLTKKALEDFKDGIGKAFADGHAGEVYTISECQLGVSQWGTSEDYLSLLIENFGLVQGSAFSQTHYPSELRQERDIAKLVQSICDPPGTVSLDERELSVKGHSADLLSQIPNAQQYHRTSDMAKHGGRDLSLDGSLNLAAPVHADQYRSIDAERQRPQPERHGLSASLQKQNALRILKAQQAPGASEHKSSSARRTTQSVPTKMTKAAEQKLCGITVDSRQKAVLRRASSWQYPLPDVAGTSSLLPPEILDEFKQKFHRGYLKPVDTNLEEIDGNRPSVLQARGHPYSNREAETAPTKSTETRTRRLSNATDRSDEPVDWSQSQPPSPAPDMPQLAIDDIHDESWRPVDSSNPTPRSDVPTSRIKQASGEGQPTTHLETPSHDVSMDGSDSGEDLDVTVPEVVGNATTTGNAISHQDARIRHTKQMSNSYDSPIASPRKSDSVQQAGPSRSSLSTPNGRHESNETLVPGTVLPERHATMAGDKPAKNQEAVRRIDSPARGGAAVRFEDPQQQQTSGQPARSQSRENEELRSFQRAGLGFEDALAEVENPAAVARRQRREFLKNRREVTQRDLCEEQSPQHLSDLDGPQPLARPAEDEMNYSPHPSNPSSNLGNGAVPAVDGQEPSPISKHTAHAQQAAQPLSTPMDVVPQEEAESTSRRLSNPSLPPNKRRRLDLETPSRHTPSSDSAQASKSRQSLASSPAVANLEDPFVAFVQAYADYDEGRRHFFKMCKEIDQLARNLHKSLWDDYVVRNITEYDETLGMSYKDFYDEHIDEPIYTKRILNPATLKQALEFSRSRTSGRGSLLVKNEERPAEETPNSNSSNKPRESIASTPQEPDVAQPKRRRTLPWKTGGEESPGYSSTNEVTQHDKAESEQCSSTDLDNGRVKLESNSSASVQQSTAEQQRKDQFDNRVGQSADDERSDRRSTQRDSGSKNPIEPSFRQLGHSGSRIRDEQHEEVPDKPKTELNKITSKLQTSGGTVKPTTSAKSSAPVTGESTATQISATTTNTQIISSNPASSIDQSRRSPHTLQSKPSSYILHTPNTIQLRQGHAATPITTQGATSTRSLNSSVASRPGLYDAQSLFNRPSPRRASDDQQPPRFFDIQHTPRPRQYIDARRDIPSRGDCYRPTYSPPSYPRVKGEYRDESRNWLGTKPREAVPTTPSTRAAGPFTPVPQRHSNGRSFAIRGNATRAAQFSEAGRIPQIDTDQKQSLDSFSAGSDNSSHTITPASGQSLGSFSGQHDVWREDGEDKETKDMVKDEVKITITDEVKHEIKNGVKAGIEDEVKEVVKEGMKDTVKDGGATEGDDGGGKQQEDEGPEETPVQEFVRSYRGLKVHGAALSEREMRDVDVLAWQF